MELILVFFVAVMNWLPCVSDGCWVRVIFSVQVFKVTGLGALVVSLGAGNDISRVPRLVVADPDVVITLYLQ